MRSGGIAGNEGRFASRAADTAVAVLCAARAVGGSHQVSIAGHLLVEHVGIHIRGNGLIAARAADGAGIVDAALGSVGCGNGNRAAVPTVLGVGGFGRCLRGRLRGRLGDRLTRDKLVEDGAAVVINQGIGIPGGGGSGGIHAHKACVHTLAEPALALHNAEFSSQIFGHLRTHSGKVHQGTQAENAAGVANDGAGGHIAAGSRHTIRGNAAHQNIDGEVGIHRRLNHSHISPLGIRLAGTVQGAVRRGVHRLRVAHVYNHRFTAIGKLGVIGVGTA